MLRSFVVVAAAALSLSLAAPAASAAPTGGGVDVSGSITCSTFLGFTTYSPALNSGEVASLTQKFNGTLTGCSTSSGLSVTSGKVNATITTDPASRFTDDCDYFTDTSVFGTGTVTVKWTSPTEVVAKSSFAVGQIHNSIYNNGPQFFFDQDGKVTGSFQGNDHGDGDDFYATSATSDNTLYNTCNGSGGLARVKLRLNPEGVEALSLS